MTTTEEKIAALEREIAKLKAAQPAPYDAEEMRKLTAEHTDKVHRMREKNANSFQFSSEVRRAMTNVGYDPCADVGAFNSAASGPRSPIVQKEPDRRHGAGVPPGGGTGIAREIRDGPSHHQRYVDAQIDAQDARDRIARIAEDKRLRAALKK